MVKHGGSPTAYYRIPTPAIPKGSSDTEALDAADDARAVFAWEDIVTVFVDPMMSECLVARS